MVERLQFIAQKEGVSIPQVRPGIPFSGWHVSCNRREAQLLVARLF